MSRSRSGRTVQASPTAPAPTQPVASTTSGGKGGGTTSTTGIRSYDVASGGNQNGTPTFDSMPPTYGPMGDISVMGGSLDRYGNRIGSNYSGGGFASNLGSGTVGVQGDAAAGTRFGLDINGGSSIDPVQETGTAGRQWKGYGGRPRSLTTTQQPQTQATTSNTGGGKGGGTTTTAPIQGGPATPPKLDFRTMHPNVQAQMIDRMQNNGITPSQEVLATMSPEQQNMFTQNNQQQQPSIFDQSASAYNQALAGTQAGMNYRPSAVNPAFGQATGYNPQGYSAANMTAAGYQGQGYNAQNMAATGYQGQGYNAAQGRAQGYNAATGRAQGYDAGQLSNTNLDPYMNPYQQEVIGGLQGDAARAQQTASNQLGAQATAAKAFGGSRHGIAEGQMAGDIQNALNSQVANLRQSGFLNAQQMAQQDIANRMTSDQFTAGAQNAMTGQNLAAINAARGFGAGAQNAMTSQNIGALNAARQFGAGAQNTANQFTAGAMNQAASQNQMAQNQAAQFGAGASNTANQFTAGAMNQAASQNQMAQNAAGQFNAGAFNAAGQFGAGAQNAMTQANMGNYMQAQMANQNAGLAGAQQRLGAANQMGALSQQGFNMGNTLNQNMSQQGALQQALQQMVMDRANQQYQGFQQSPYTALSALTGALGASPSPMTSTQQQNRGLFDYLGMGLYGASLF